MLGHGELSEGTSPRERGKPKWDPGGIDMDEEHPRVSGENGDPLFLPELLRGTSPRERGKPLVHQRVWFRVSNFTFNLA